jgi:hypothetical protein
MKRARAILALGFLALVVGSVARSIPATAVAWHGERVRFEHYSASDRAHAPAENSMPMDPRVFDAWRDQLRPGDTFTLQLGLVNTGLKQNIESFTHFAMLPHVQVDRKSADVVLSLLADPRTLDLRYSSVHQMSNGVWAARVAHGR